MKIIPLRLAASCLGLVCPLAAQDLSGPDATEVAVVLSPEHLPAIERARSEPADGPALIAGPGAVAPQPDLGLVSVPVSGSAADVVGALAAHASAGSPAARSEEIARKLEKASAAYRAPGTEESDCGRVGLSVEERLKKDSSELLEAVETEIRANPGCSCEVVKAAIRATDAETEKVVAIVETAMLTAPEHVRLISQCAIAAAPESLSAIQSLLARYDANAGEAADSAKSAKSSKDSKAAIAAESDSVAAITNPLDFPGNGPVGPQSGMPGGNALVPVTPPIVAPPVTAVDP